MKNYEEMAKLVLEARDEYVKKKKNRVLFLKRASVVTFGVAAVLGIGIFTHAMKPPKKPVPSQSGIIVETETNSTDTTKQLPDVTTAVTAMTTSSTTGQKTTETTFTSETTTETQDTTETSETETEAATETTTRTKAPRTTSNIRTVDATWTEAVPLQPDPNIKKASAPKFFDPDEVYNNTDIIFDGTIIGSTEYEVSITDSDGNNYTNRVTVLDVTVDYVYYGETDKELVKVLWKSSLPMQAMDIYKEKIVVGSEYIFMLQELCEEYPDISWAYRYADYELRSSVWNLVPAYGDIAGIYRDFFKNDEEAMSMSLAKEELIGIIPGRMTE